MKQPSASAITTILRVLPHCCTWFLLKCLVEWLVPEVVNSLPQNHEAGGTNDRDSHLDLRSVVKNHDDKWQVEWINHKITFSKWHLNVKMSKKHYIYRLVYCFSGKAWFILLFLSKVAISSPEVSKWKTLEISGEQANEAICCQLHSLKDN